MPTVWGRYQKGKQKFLKEKQEICYTALGIGLSYLNALVSTEPINSLLKVQ